MSRSRKSNSICGITRETTEKEFKAETNRALRVAVRSAMAHEDPIMPINHDVRTQWGPKDGKHWFDPAKYPELMRK